MATGKTYRLEYYEDGKWKSWGVYPERFINQMAAGICDLYKRGYKPYETMRISEAE